MIHRFTVGSLVRNNRTNEDGRVKNVYEERNVVMYQVSVPNDPTSWEMGAVEAHWPENELDLSTNQCLQ